MFRILMELNYALKLHARLEMHKRGKFFFIGRTQNCPSGVAVLLGQLCVSPTLMMSEFCGFDLTAKLGAVDVS